MLVYSTPVFAAHPGVAMPKQSASWPIAKARLLRDAVAVQQTDYFSMPRWNMLLAAAAVAGGAMLIENGHRIDTGPPDDDIVTSAPDCTVVYAVNRQRMRLADEAILREKAAAALPSECADR